MEFIKNKIYVKKKVNLSILVFIVVCLCLIMSFYIVNINKLKQENDYLESNINNYNSLLKDIEKYELMLEDISVITTNKNELNEKKEKLETEIEELNEKVRNLTNKIKEIESKT